MRKIKKNVDGQQGLGLIEVLIMSSAALLLIVFMLQSFNDYNKYQKLQTLRLDRLFLKSYINDSVDCTETIKEIGLSCTDGEPVKIFPILDSTGEHLIKIFEKVDKNYNDYTKIGNYQIRATCDGGNRIKIESRLVNRSNKPLTDPKNRSKKTTWKEMYKKIPFKCNPKVLRWKYE